MATLEQHLSLTAQQQELVAVGASVGAGCHPCVSHHLKAAVEVGLHDDQLLAAVASAERVTAEASVQMDDHIRAKLGADLRPALLSRVEETLASMGAALAANDKENIERQIKAALELGVPREQVREAIETARVVQENAARLHIRDAHRLLESTESVTPQPADAGCGCGSDDES
jgi:AhpD family alkylhydroperoxidase